MKKADGMNRNLMLKGYEPNGYENKGLVYPLASWTQKDVLAYMKHKRLPQPVRYSSKAGGGVGFSKETFTWLEKALSAGLREDIQSISNERENFI